nr:SUMF1/EgtB/PvdO family nonheme iron enzyme [Providencia burhodogranariea]
MNESLVVQGNYYVGPVFGKYDYQSNTNVTLDSYYIMRTEITYNSYNETLLWARGHGYNFNDGCNGSIYDDCRSSEADNKEHPITNIAWLDTIIFANALSEKLGLSPVYITEQNTVLRDTSQYKFIVNYHANGYRLPTMIEWMVAARGGKPALEDGTYGNYYSGSNNVKEVAWFPTPNTDQFGTSPVGKLKANALWLYDMSGNVYEWVYDSETTFNNAMYYFCGGSYLQPGILSSCDVHSAGFVMPDIGFRLVRSAKW